MFNQILMVNPTLFRNIVISANQTNWNLITEAFGGSNPTSKALVTITINAGVDLDGANALDVRGLFAGSRITLINNGDVIAVGGAGGKGGNHIAELDVICLHTENDGVAGVSGGNAIIIDGTDVDLTITNANGHIFGGGGGGAGSDACTNVGLCKGTAGSGGGGGAGVAAGGAKGTGGGGSRSTDGNAGSAGTGGVAGVAGVGGAGVVNGCTSNAGGTAGEYGVAGSGVDGQSGGPAGFAIRRPTGTGTTSFVSGDTGARRKGAVE